MRALLPHSYCRPHRDDELPFDSHPMQATTDANWIERLNDATRTRCTRATWTRRAIRAM